jgi:ATP-dependent Clp protease ATP-binding subunit ClpC
MQTKFTAQAEEAMTYAESVMKEFKHSYLGTEHLLLGLVHVKDSVARIALLEQKIREADLRQKIKDVIGYGHQEVTEKVECTPRVTSILENSALLAKQSGSFLVGTEHLLVILLKERTSVAVQLLESLGVDATRIINHIGKLISANTTPQKEVNFNTATASSTLKSTTPTLDKYSRDLTLLARENKFDPIVGREKEIERIVQILSRRTKNNPCLVGEPGVGKTAVVEGLAQRIAEQIIPDLLKDKRVVSLDLSMMISGTKYRGEFEDRINKVLEEVRSTGDIILFIDELHTIIGAGGAEGAMDASNILKPALSRGEIQIIGATTLEEYRKHIEKDAALERRFQPVHVEEPTEGETFDILKGIREKYETHHKVSITEQAMLAAVKLSNRYITDRYLPDKAIDLIDEAASRVRLRAFTSPEAIKMLEEKLAVLAVQKENAIIAEDYTLAAEIKQQENDLKIQIETEKNAWQEKHSQDKQIVTEEEIAEIVSTWTKIPVQKLAQEESKRLLDMEKILHERVIGQEEAVKAVSKAIRRGRVGIKDPNRPIGSFLFLGPTGVGKTELSKTLAEAMFGDEQAIIRIDMSEYMEKHTVSKLIGSPPGYVGYEEGGQLTEKVRRKPYSVILFDEIEKAHPDVFNILLQILDDGHITDSTGRKINFKNTVIIMTSNIGARNIVAPKRVGFISQEDAEKTYSHMKSNVMEEVKRLFRPEFLNRIDEVLVFHPLSSDHIKDITKVMLSSLTNRLKKNIAVELIMTDEAIEFLAKKGYDQAYGARPLRRAIQTHIEDQLSDKLLEEEIKNGDILKVGATEETLTFEKQ